MLVIGTCAESSQVCTKLAQQHQNIYAAVGVHPNDTIKATDDDYLLLRELCKDEKVRAIGETGLDWFHEFSPRETQKEHFIKHLDLAEELNLPVVIHARNSAEECLDIFEPYAARGVKGVWHCFSAGKKVLPQLLERALEMDLYLGISGMVTFEEQKPLRNIISKIPDKHLLLDSDSPYLTPRPKITDRNEPSRVLQIAQTLAELRGVTTEDIARITTRNACDFLGLPRPEQNHEQLAYPIRDSLYLNITNDCTNNCTFCARNNGFIVKGHDISLDHNPSSQELIEAIEAALAKVDAGFYKEVVFCGYGEPTMCLETVLTVGKYLKEKGFATRLNSNGLANLYFKRDITPELSKVIDKISISLNTADPEQYDALCRSQFGKDAFPGMLEFTACCLKANIHTTLSVVDMPDIDVEAARRLAEEIGAHFRARSFVDAG